MLPVKYEPKYNVAFAPHIFNGEVYTAEIPVGVPLQKLFGERDNYEGFYVEVDGVQVELLPAEEFYLVDGQLVTIKQIPQDKDTLRTVLAIAAIVVITLIAPELGFVAGTWEYAAFVAVASLAASLAINTLIPFDDPTSSSTSGKRTEGLAPPRNELNPYAPIAQLFGKIKQYPAYAALPFTEVQGNDQYMNALFLVTYGQTCTPTSIKIGSTEVANFEGFDIKYVTAGNVDYPAVYEEQLSLSFDQPDLPGDTHIRTTVPDAKYIGLDIVFPNGLCWLNEDGDRYQVAVNFKIEVRLVGTTTWKQIKSGENSINKWEDLTWGTNSTTSNGVTVSNPSSVFLNSITRDWYTVSMVGGKLTPTYENLFRVTGMTFDTIRRGLKFLPPDGAGQYDVRLTRVSTTRPNAYPTDLVSEASEGTAWQDSYVASGKWVALRTFKNAAAVVPLGATSGDDKIVYAQLRIKATDQLAGALDQFSHVVQRSYLYWNGAAWVQDSTTAASQVYPRSPAWAAVEVLTGDMNPRPVLLEKIDATAFRTWADWCVANGFYYDEEIYGAQSVWEVLRGIAASGRAEIVVRDGLYTVVQDIAQATPVQMFTPRNSTGFRGSKSYIEKIHGVKVSYRSEAEDYEEIEQTVYADGYTVANATKFETLTLNGITNDRQAWREGRRYMGIAIHRPEYFEIKTDIEHLACTRGDTVLVQHEAALVGQQTLRIIGVTQIAQRSRIILDGEVFMEVGKTYSIQLRYLVGTTITISTYGIYAQVNANTVLTDARVPDSLAAGGGAGVLASFGETNLVTLRCKVLAIAPKNDLSAALTLIPEGAPLYNADTGTIPPYDPVITQPPDFTRIVPDAPIIIAVTSGGWSSSPQPDGTIFQRLMVTYLVNHLQSFRGLEVQGRIRESSALDEIVTVVADWRATDWMAHDGGSMWFDHIQANVVYDVQVRVRSLPYLLTSEWSAVSIHTVGTVDHVPPLITNLAIESMVNGVRVLVDTTDVVMRDALYIEILYATVNDRNDASAVKYTYNVPAIITPIDVIAFPLPLPDGQLYYFWARMVNRFNVAGPWYPEDVTVVQDIRVTSTSDTRVTSTGDIRVIESGAVGPAGVTGFALQDLVWYILPTRGTAIKNGAGTLRVEAHKFSTDGDAILTAGTIRMYKPDGTTLAGDGYIWDNIGASDIVGSLVLTLKDSVSGKVYDTVTLQDITDGVATPNLPLAYFDGYTKMIWRRDKDSGAWQPDTAAIPVNVTFLQGTTEVARDAMSLSLNTTTGAITVSAATHPGGDLNAGSITWKINGSVRTLPYADGVTVLLEASYVINGQTVTASETFYSVEGGTQGTPGAPGTSGSLTVSIKANYKTFTVTRNNNAYVHGFDGSGVATDGNGTMVHNGAQVTITKGTLLASQESLRDGWVLFDTAVSNVFTDNGSNLYSGVANYNLVLVKRFRDGWKYDAANHATSPRWVAFTLTSAMVIFASYTKSGVGDATGSITGITTFGNGVMPGSIPVEEADIVKPGDISAQAITSVAQFAASLNPIGIVTDIATITGGTWAGPLVVFDTVTRKQYRLVSNTPAVWTTQIVAYEDLAANSIRAGQIEAGAIGADQIAAQAIRASKLAVMTQGMALNLNPQLDDLDAWHYLQSALYANRLSADADYSLVSATNNIGLTALRVVAASNEAKDLYSKPINCDQAKTYRVSCWARRLGVGTNKAWLLVAFLDNTGANIPGSGSGASGWTSYGTYFYWRVANESFPQTTWTKYEFTFGANGEGTWPAVTPRMMQIGALATYTTGSSTTVEFQDFRIEEVLPGVLIQDGTITANKIAANAVTADKIQANAITAEKIAAGSISAEKMQIGGANLVVNPGFEFGADSWTVLSGTLTAVTTTPHQGGYCGLVPINSIVIGYPVPVAPGDVIVFGVWVRTTGGTPSGGTIRLMYLDDIGSSGAVATLWSGTVVGSWTNFTGQYTVPAGINSVYFDVRTSPFGSSALYVDDFRILNATTNALLVNGAVTADKLTASLILTSALHTADPASLGRRVTIDNSTVPIWVGSGAKTRANAMLQLDTATAELLFRGRIEASRLGFADNALLGVDSSYNKLAPIVGILLDRAATRELTLSTTMTAFGDGIYIYHPNAGVDGDYRTGGRLQVNQQAFFVEWEANIDSFDNTTVGGRLVHVALHHSYDSSGIWTNSGCADQRYVSRSGGTVANGYMSHRTLMGSEIVKPRSSWTDSLHLRLFAAKDAGAPEIRVRSFRFKVTIINLGNTYIYGNPQNLN